MLARLGCDFGQGFLIARPATAEALERMLAPAVPAGVTAKPEASSKSRRSATRQRLSESSRPGLLHDDLDVPVMAPDPMGPAVGRRSTTSGSRWSSLFATARPVAWTLPRSSPARASDDGVDIVAMGHGDSRCRPASQAASDRSSRFWPRSIADHLDSPGTSVAARPFASCPIATPSRVCSLRSLPNAELIRRPVGAACRPSRGTQASIELLVAQHAPSDPQGTQPYRDRRPLARLWHRPHARQHRACARPARNDSHHRDHVSGRESDLDDPAARELWHRLITAHVDAGLVEISSVMIDGEVAGYVVGILDGNSYRVFDGHFETEYSRYSPGRLVEAAVLERAMLDPRFTELDWMAGVAAEKILVSNRNEGRRRLFASAVPATGDRAITVTGPAVAPLPRNRRAKAAGAAEPELLKAR